MPGVSFVIPIYNKEPYLKDVLAQLKAQRGDFARQYVFVDDGSTDGSLDLLRDLTKDWDDVVIEAQANAGSAAATNKGVSLAIHSYVKFCDADDLLHSDATQNLLSVMLDNTGVVIVYGNESRFRDVKELKLDEAVQIKASNRLVQPVKQSLFNSLFNPTQCLVDRAVYIRSGGCDERIVFSQEYTMTMRMARLGDFIHVDVPIAYLPVEVVGRLSNNEGRQLQRVTRAVANFVGDYPDTTWQLKQKLCRRTASRAWKYQHRINKAFWLTNPYFWQQIRAYFPVLNNQAAFIENTATAFDAMADQMAKTKKFDE